jgi:hypothetical protein
VSGAGDPTPRFLFDENIPAGIVIRLRNTADLPGEKVHITELGHGGAQDSEWIPRIAQEGWTVISGDRGKRRPKLPQLCVQHQVTHVVLGASVHGMRIEEKLQAFVSVWEELVQIAQDERGRGYVLVDEGGPVLRPRQR